MLLAWIKQFKTKQFLVHTNQVDKGRISIVDTFKKKTQVSTVSRRERKTLGVGKKSSILHSCLFSTQSCFVSYPLRGNRRCQRPNLCRLAWITRINPNNAQILFQLSVDTTAKIRNPFKCSTIYLVLRYIGVFFDDYAISFIRLDKLTIARKIQWKNEEKWSWAKDRTLSLESQVNLRNFTQVIE